MKAVAVTDVGVIKVVEVPEPGYGPYECLVRVRACGLCNSTDLKIIHDEISSMKVRFPVILGHEGAGEVVEVGAKVRNLKPGDRVISPEGRLGPNSGYNVMWAGMAQYAVIKDIAAMREDGAEGLPSRPELYAGSKIPDGIGFADASVILTLKETYSALKNFGVKPGMDVLIYGDGPVGLGLASFLRMMGAGWVGCVGHRQDRLEKIHAVGRADRTINAHHQDLAQALGDRRFDLVIDAVGSTQIIRQAATLLKPGGTVGLYGVLKPSDCHINFLELPNHIKIHLLNFPYREHDETGTILDLIQSGSVKPGDYYSHTLPIEEVATAIQMIESREAYKVILTM